MCCPSYFFGKYLHCALPLPSCSAFIDFSSICCPDMCCLDFSPIWHFICVLHKINCWANYLYCALPLPSSSAYIDFSTCVAQVIFLLKSKYMFKLHLKLHCALPLLFCSANYSIFGGTNDWVARMIFYFATLAHRDPSQCTVGTTKIMRLREIPNKRGNWKKALTGCPVACPAPPPANCHQCHLMEQLVMFKYWPIHAGGDLIIKGKSRILKLSHPIAELKSMSKKVCYKRTDQHQPTPSTLWKEIIVIQMSKWYSYLPLVHQGQY